MTSTIDLEKKELRLRVREELSALSRSELVRGDNALFAEDDYN